MDPTDINFASFFTARLKEQGVSLKKLSELTGIARGHLENIARGNFGDLPSAPYFRGYLISIGRVLDFDGEEWWKRIKEEGWIKNAGPLDALPRNRFIKKSQAKFIWIGIATLILVVYLAFQLPKIFGRPNLTITFPDRTPYNTSSSTVTLQGFVRGADSLSLNGDGVTIAGDSSWQKTALLQSGVNTFQITAKKFLGGEADLIEQILYIPPIVTGNASTSPTSTPEIP